MHGLLALDIATRTGWAYAPRDLVACWPETPLSWAGSSAASGVKHGSQDNGAQGAGWQVNKHRTWVLDLLTIFRPRILIFEAPVPQAQRSVEVARKIWYLCGATEDACHVRGVSCREDNLSTIRKHFLGANNRQGKSADKKAAVMSECLRRGFEPVDYDASDAIAVLDYGACLYRKRFQ